MKKSFALIAAAGALFAAQPTLAATLTSIDAIAGNTATSYEVSGSQISVDFDFASYSPTTLNFAVDQGDAAAYNFDSAVNFFSSYGADSLTLALTGGATFDLGNVAAAFSNAIASLNAAGDILTISFSPTEYVGVELGALDSTVGDFLINRNGLNAGDAFSLTVTAGAVPEPATWAMMIAGFGLVGGVMRRRQDKIALAA